MASEGDAHQLVVSGEELQELQPHKKRHRHTDYQIREMELFFMETPHPNDKQRKELSQVLGLEPLQVKFWFQNRRTHKKTQQERQENAQLRAENAHYKELAGPAIVIEDIPENQFETFDELIEMSFDEEHLHVENARLQNMFGPSEVSTFLSDEFLVCSRR